VKTAVGGEAPGVGREKVVEVPGGFFVSLARFAEADDELFFRCVLDPDRVGAERGGAGNGEEGQDETGAEDGQVFGFHGKERVRAGGELS
jgi:hypothetical protein